MTFRATRRLAPALLLVLLAVPARSQDRLGIDLSAMDRSVRPQDDLFRYTNGRWVETTPIPADRGRYGAFDALGERARDDVRAIIDDAVAGRIDDPDARRIGALYQAVMDSARVERLGVTPLAPDLARIEALDSPRALVRYFGENARTFGPSPVGGYVGIDDRRSTQYTFALSQGGTGLPDRSYYLEERFAPVREAYVGYLARLHELAGLGDGEAAARTALALETRLAEAQWTRVQMRDPEATYNKVAVSDLVAAYPNLHLDVFLRERGVAGRLDSVVVRQPSYLAALDELLPEIPLADWKAYARVRTLSEASGVLPQAFGDASFDFYGRTLSGQPSDSPRWKKAVAATSGTLGEAIGRIYVSRHYPPEARARMEAMIGHLQEAFRQSIHANPWMSAATRAEALRKLDAYTIKIGHPDEWQDYSALEIRPDDLAGNVRRTAAWAYDEALAKLDGPVDRSEWGMTPQTVNAYYNPVFNEIVFPAAILQPPFFNVEADDAVNYGAIGAVIGHEFSHGFDDQGSQYDAAGNLRNWWSEADRAEFERRTDRLVAQYDAYRPFAGDSAHVDGRLTLGENIGDLSGLTMAHRAYRLSLDRDGDGAVSADEEAPVIGGLTGDQRFFMGWAQVWRTAYRDAMLQQLLRTDVHSPGMYRANGPLPHIPAFYAAFDVQPGDALYLPPSERIVLW